MSWKGITLYGIIDAAVQYETHGAPFNDYFISGGSDIVQKNSNNSVFGVTSNGLSQSRVGLQGSEPLHFLDFSGVFKLETFFNPASGNITDALKSVTQNNGRSLADQSTNIDSSIAGQIFQQSFVGISSPTYGTVTFGRQNTTLADLFAKYDPQQVSYAFSLVGLSGTPAGGGDTQDRRLDDSVKYTAKFFDIVHLGVQYKFQNSSAENYSDRWQRRGIHRDRGFAGRASMRGVGRCVLHESEGRGLGRCVERRSSHGIAGGLFARQVAVRHDLGQCVLRRSWAPTRSVRRPSSRVYQHITYMNPSIKLDPGFNDIGGYTLAYVNNTAYAKETRICRCIGRACAITSTRTSPPPSPTTARSRYAYATGADPNCSNTISGACSGHLNTASVSLVYHFTKRFDSYAGAMWSNVSHGLANGYPETTMIDPTVGLRYSF